MEPLFWVGGLAFVAAISSGISLVISIRAGSPHDLRTKVRALDNDLTDLIDRVEHWRGRDAVRKMRAGQGEVAPPVITREQYKAALRQRAVPGGRP